MRISPPFSLKLFVLFIKYKAKLHFHSISVPVKDDLSFQEEKLSFGFEMVSQDWVSEMEFSTELVEYGGRRWAYDGSMGRESSMLGIVLINSNMGLLHDW